MMIDLKEYKCVGMYRVLAEITDSAEGAIFLSQLIYWDRHVNNEWFYKTREEWYFETAIKKDRQISLCKQLVALEILETKIQGLPARTHYRLNRQKLAQRFDALVNPERYLRTEKNVTPTYYQKSDWGRGDPVNLNKAIPITSCRDPDDPLEVSRQPVAGLPSNRTHQSTEKPPTSQWNSLNWVIEIPTTGQAEYPQPVMRNADNQLVGRPTLYKEKNTHENTHENKHENTHESTHETILVDSGKPTTSHRDPDEALDGQIFATELLTNQNAPSGNSSPATRRGGEETESLNQSSQITQANDLAHQEADVGAHHLQTIKENLALAKKSDTRVAAIFSHWQTALNHPHAKLDDKRKRLIRAALKMGYTTEQLKQAIDGCSKTPHNLGDNDRGQRYDGLHIILRNADQIDRFMVNAINPPRKMNAQERLEADNERVGNEWLRKHGINPDEPQGAIYDAE